MTANILDGIVLGFQYGLLAAGLTLVYGMGGVLNLAYGQMGVIAAITSSLAMDAGVSILPALGLGLLMGGLLGLLLDRTILIPVYRLRHEARVLLSLLLTLGFAFIVDGFLNWRYPLKALNIFLSGGAMDILGVPMRRGSLLATAITLVVMGLLFVFFRYTTLGQAVRSVIEDEEGARLVGIDPSRMMRIILVISGVLAALVAITRSMVIPVDVQAGFPMTVFALIVAVVGGLGSVSGALLAGILLGIVYSIAAAQIGTFMSLVILLAAAAVTILIRPSGLLGVAE